MADPHEMLGLNKAYWDAAAAVHGNGRDQTYDLAGLLAGRDTLSAAENAALQEAAPSVEGLDVLHVQCHIGFETISLARRGAIVTGVDLSPASLDKARDLPVVAGCVPRSSRPTPTRCRRGCGEASISPSPPSGSSTSRTNPPGG
ncbi:class I SAM-dependent methyltransferase [Streptomyces albus]